MRRNKTFFAVVFIGLIIAISLVSVFLLSVFKTKEIEYGATFSARYARSLALEPNDVLRASVEELGIKKIRIPVYWSDIETKQGEYNFSELDDLMNYAEVHDLKVTLAIGVKVPRWPECFAPEWADLFTDDAFDQSVLDFVTVVVNRYKDSVALERWQVENEPYFPFGECRYPNPERVQAEIALVNNLDGNHDIQQTTSGEQSLWFLKSKGSDVLGVSLYREAWNYATGEFVFPYSSMFYNAQRVLAETRIEKIIISELQAEPWLSATTFTNTTDSINEYYLRFTAEDLLANIRFAKRTGVDEVYFWGIEWWYYLKENGESSLWNTAKEIINQ